MDRKKTSITLEYTIGILYYLFVFSVFFSWRMSIGFLSSGKSVDIRIEDVLIALIAILAFILILAKKGKCCQFNSVEQLIALWFLLKINISVFSLLYTPFLLSRFFYLLKELEFLLMILVFPLFAQRVNKYVVYRIIIFGGAANAMYIFWQLTTGNLMGIRHGYYGIAMIGEYSPLNSGLILSFLAISFFLLEKRSLSFLYVCFTILTMSRASIVGLIITIFGSLGFKHILMYLFVILIFVSFVIFHFGEAIPWTFRMISWEYAISSIKERFLYDYSIIFGKMLGLSFIFGHGKGLWGIEGLPIEAHNYFLRVFFEEGFFGLFVVFLLIVYILRLKPDVLEARLLKMTLYLLFIASLFQDAMATQKGLSLLVVSTNLYRISRKERLMAQT